MIFSNLPSPAEAGFAKAGNRCPLFGIMRYRGVMSVTGLRGRCGSAGGAGVAAGAATGAAGGAAEVGSGNLWGY